MSSELIYFCKTPYYIGPRLHGVRLVRAPGYNEQFIFSEQRTFDVEKVGLQRLPFVTNRFLEIKLLVVSDKSDHLFMMASLN